jgi:prepilin-type N-terminal cleavage/methylation domain-containing protein
MAAGAQASMRARARGRLGARERGRSSARERYGASTAKPEILRSAQDDMMRTPLGKHVILSNAKNLSGRRAHRAAFTIIELLVVITIISILLGISTGIYFKFVRTTALMGEQRAVMAVIQMARSTAVEEGGETFVCIDTENNQIYPFGREKVGVWHFETLGEGLSRGALRQGALVAPDGAIVVLADGKVGKAIQLDGTAYLKCKLYRAPQWINIPTYNARDGLAIEAWVAPVNTGAAKMNVFKREGWFEMALTWDAAAEMYKLSARVVTLDPDYPSEDDLRYKYCSATSQAVIRPGEWTHLRMSYHKMSDVMALEINGNKVDTFAHSDTGSVPEDSEPLDPTETAIGAAADGSDAFTGRIDELIVSAYTVDTVHKVTSKLSLEAARLADGNTIRFNASGRLTSAHDGKSPRVILREYKEATAVSSATITVGAMGAMDVEVEYK